MTLEEAIAWCAAQKTTVKFDRPRKAMLCRPSNAVLVTADCEIGLCHGSGSTFVEAVESCNAYLTKVLEARARAKAARR